MNFGKKAGRNNCASRRSADLKTQTTAMDRRDAGMNRHKREMDRRKATVD